MEKIGIDVHKVASQVCIQMDDGTWLERRIATSHAAFAKLLGDRPRARIVLEASTESEWVARSVTPIA